MTNPAMNYASDENWLQKIKKTYPKPLQTLYSLFAGRKQNPLNK